MQVKNQGAVLFVIGSDSQVVEYRENVLQHITNVKAVHLTNRKQLRGRTPASKKFFVVLSKNHDLGDIDIDRQVSHKALRSWVQKNLNKVPAFDLLDTSASS